MIRLAFLSFSCLPVAGVVEAMGERLALPDLSLILSPFVYRAWGALRLWLPFIFIIFFSYSPQERGPRGGPSPFLLFF